MQVNSQILQVRAAVESAVTGRASEAGSAQSGAVTATEGVQGRNEGRCTGRGADSAVREALLRGVGGGLAAAVEAQLREDVAHVVARRVLADDELRRDLFVRRALGNEGQHFALARRQVVPVVAGALHADELLDDALRDLRVEQRFSACHRPQRLEQPRAGDVLQHVSCRARQQRGDDRFLLGERRQHQHLRRRQLAAHLAAGRDAVHAVHPHVHQHDVRLVRTRLLDRVSAVRRFGDHSKVRLDFERRAKAHPYHLVVIDDHQPRLHESPPIGTETLMCVPSPGSLRTPSVPPTSSTRWRRLPMP